MVSNKMLLLKSPMNPQLSSSTYLQGSISLCVDSKLSATMVLTKNNWHASADCFDRQKKWNPDGVVTNAVLVKRCPIAAREHQQVDWPRLEKKNGTHRREEPQQSECTTTTGTYKQRVESTTATVHCSLTVLSSKQDTFANGANFWGLRVVVGPQKILQMLWVSFSKPTK